MEAVLAVLAGGAIAGMVLIARNTISQVVKQQGPGPSAGQAGRSTSSAEQVSRVPAHSIIFPDYVDEQLLDEVAQQLDVNIEPVGLTLGTAARQSVEGTSSVEAGVQAGPVKVGETVSESEREEKEESAAVSYRRRPNFRSKIRGVLDELDSRAELVVDLKKIPDTVIPEATFVQASLVLKFEWDLVGVEPGDGTEEDVRPQVVRDLTAVEQHAKDQIWQGVVARFREIGREQQGRFALVASRWHVHKENGHLALGVAELDTGALVPRAFPEMDDIAAPSHEIWVPLASNNLSSHGEQRVVEDHFVEAVVFGRIDCFDREREALVLLPIAIYSEQDPSSAATPSEEHDAGRK